MPAGAALREPTSSIPQLAYGAAGVACSNFWMVLLHVLVPVSIMLCVVHRHLKMEKEASVYAVNERTNQRTCIVLVSATWAIRVTLGLQ